LNWVNSLLALFGVTLAWGRPALYEQFVMRIKSAAQVHLLLLSSPWPRCNEPHTQSLTLGTHTKTYTHRHAYKHAHIEPCIHQQCCVILLQPMQMSKNHKYFAMSHTHTSSASISSATSFCFSPYKCLRPFSLQFIVQEIKSHHLTKLICIHQRRRVILLQPVQMLFIVTR